MASFQRIWENMIAAKQQEGHDHDAQSMQAIRSGLNIKEDFWEDFLQVINNSSALSVLLDVPTTKIASWHNKVRHALKKVQEADQTPDAKDKGKIMSTGNAPPGQSAEPDPKTSVTNMM